MSSIVTYNYSGVGAYGMVFKGNDLHSGEKVALKKIVQMDKERNLLPKSAIREIQILKKLRNKNIIGFKEIGDSLN